MAVVSRRSVRPSGGFHHSEVRRRSGARTVRMSDRADPDSANAGRQVSMSIVRCREKRGGNCSDKAEVVAHRSAHLVPVCGTFASPQCRRPSRSQHVPSVVAQAVVQSASRSCQRVSEIPKREQSGRELRSSVSVRIACRRGLARRARGIARASGGRHGPQPASDRARRTFRRPRAQDVTQPRTAPSALRLSERAC